MNAWWWVPIGLASWVAAATAVGLLLGRFLKRSAQPWDPPHPEADAIPAQRQESPQCERNP
jgi:hypothetical protein